MTQRLQIVEAPEDFPFTVGEAKEHLRVDFDDDDEIIEAMLEAAVDYVDGPKGALGRALVDQTWDLYLDTFFSYRGYVEVPLPPLIEILGIYYLDASKIEQLFDPAGYRVDPSSEPARVYSAAWPSLAPDEPNAVRIRFRAGYLDRSVSPPEDAVPSGIKAAIKLLLGSLYENRESFVVGDTATDIPFSVDMLLRKHKIYLGMA